MNVSDLLLAHEVVSELMQNTSRQSYNQQFQVVLNVIAAEVVKIMKKEQQKD